MVPIIGVARIFDWGGPIPVADLENFGGGDFKHKRSKIRMSSPKLRVMPKSEIRTFFPPKIRWSPKKKRSSPKLRVIFRPKSEISNVFSAQNQVVSKKKKKKLRVIFRPKPLALLLIYCLITVMYREIRTFFRPKSGGLQKKKVFTEIESDFSAEIGNSNVFSAQNQVVSKKKKKN